MSESKQKPHVNVGIIGGCLPDPIFLSQLLHNDLVLLSPDVKEAFEILKQEYKDLDLKCIVIDDSPRISHEEVIEKLSVDLLPLRIPLEPIDRIDLSDDVGVRRVKPKKKVRKKNKFAAKCRRRNRC